jgi:hypothetical protein
MRNGGFQGMRTVLCLVLLLAIDAMTSRADEPGWEAVSGTWKADEFEGNGTASGDTWGKLLSKEW